MDKSQVKMTLLETIATSNNPTEISQARAALDKLSGTAEPKAPEITGPVVLGTITISAEYARELQKKYGNLGAEATKEASGERLTYAVSNLDDKAKFLAKFPEDENFFDDAAAKVKALYASMDAEIARRHRLECHAESVSRARAKVGRID